MTDLTFCATRNCDSCAWCINVGEDTLCMRDTITIPVKGLTTVLDGDVCQWNKAGSVGMQVWERKFYNTPEVVSFIDSQHESQVGPIDQLHVQ